MDAVRPSAGDESQLINYLVRMVVPLRREFGRQLDVGQFLRERAYARSILDEALGSQDPRLLDYARYVERLLHGPRLNEAAPAISVSEAVGSAQDGAPESALPEDQPPANTEEDLRAQVLRKYSGGLR